MKSKKIPKILAPAGSRASLVAAVEAGCDEVYFGIAEMNMRATAAKNFTMDNLKDTVEYCHENGVKTCVTVNTLLYNEDLPMMKEIIDAIADSGADAAIVADMAAIQYAREKGVEVHISTQISISNTEELKFYSQFADRVVLARELKLEQVAQICKDVKEQQIKGPGGELVEIEVFAHGAICVAVSGRCAMSLYCYNTSANRGKCTQPCRRAYKVTDKQTGRELEVDNNYVMSAADLCSIGMLDELVESGVSVLKFEGRGRPPEYVDMVISTYREALTAIEEDNYTDEKISKWNKDLKTVFNRGQSAGFYMGRRMDEWAGVRSGKATKKKVFAGKVDHYYSDIKVAQINIQGKVELKEGDEFLISGDNTGVVKGHLKGMRVDEKEVGQAKQGDEITLKVKRKVRRNDDFYLIRSQG